MTEESLRYIKNVWMEGNNTLCLGIPSEIVKKLNLNPGNHLLVELVDDSIIAIKKINPQFTKDEINKAIADNKINEKRVDGKQLVEDGKEFYNPLKNLKI